MSALGPITPVIERIRRAHEGFEGTLSPTLSRTAKIVIFGTVLLSLALFFILAPEGFELGDGPLYAEYIKDASLHIAPKHIAYYALGIGFTRIIPLPLDHALNLMSAVFASLSLGLVGAIAYTLTGRWLAALGAGMCTGAAYVFATNAVNAEVYIVQVFFFLLCVVFVLRDRPLLAGLAFAGAFLATPSTLLAIPFLVALRPRARFLLVSGAAALTLASAALAPVHREFLWGSHGLLTLVPSNITPSQALSKEFREFTGFLAALPPIAVGLWVLGSSPRHRLPVAGLVLLWLAQLAFGERYSDVPVQLPLYAMLGVVGGIGIARLAHGWPTRRIGPILAAASVVTVIVVAGAVPYRAITAEAAAVDDYRETVMAMGAASRPGDIAVAPFATRALAEHYLGASSVPRWVSDEALAGQQGADAQATAQQALGDAVAGKRKVWLPGDFDQSAGAFFSTQGYEIVPFRTIFVAQPIESP